MKVLFLVSFIFLFMGCGDSDTEMLLPKKDDKNVTEKVKDLTITSKVDILFVVDDSGSMDPVQDQIATNIDKFLKDFVLMKFINFHFGVLSSGMSSYSNKLGALKGIPLFVTNKTTDLVDKLKRNIMLGSDGSSTEGFFDPIYYALTDPLLSGHNAGFYRPDSLLVIVFITDAEDQSKTIKKAQDLYDFLIDLKGGDSRKLLTFGALMPIMNDCTYSEDQQIEILEFFHISGGSYFNICRDDFGAELSKMSASIYDRANFIPLREKPYLPSIKITYGNQVIPHSDVNGWSYDSKRIGIFFGPEMKLVEQDGAELKINYTPADKQ